MHTPNKGEGGAAAAPGGTAGVGGGAAVAGDWYPLRGGTPAPDYPLRMDHRDRAYSGRFSPQDVAGSRLPSTPASVGPLGADYAIRVIPRHILTQETRVFIFHVSDSKWR